MGVAGSERKEELLKSGPTCLLTPLSPGLSNTLGISRRIPVCHSISKDFHIEEDFKKPFPGLCPNASLMQNSLYCMQLKNRPVAAQYLQTGEISMLKGPQRVNALLGNSFQTSLPDASQSYLKHAGTWESPHPQQPVEFLELL